MPDIGLLQGAPPRRSAPPPPGIIQPPPAASDCEVTERAAVDPAAALAIRYQAPDAYAISVQVVSAPEAPRAAVVSTGDDGGSFSARRSGATQVPGGRVPPLPIRASDLLWLALAFVIIIGTGVG